MRLGVNASGRGVNGNIFSPFHWLLSGATRSGKSTALYTLLKALAPRDDVVVAGVDPSGIVFNALGGGLGGGRLRVMTLSNVEEIRRVLTDLIGVMERRILGLLDQRLDKITGFSSEYPLLVVVFEEYPGALAAIEAIDKANGAKPAQRVETFFRAAVQRLALEGAKVGIRLVILTQRADAAILTGVLRSQLTVKLSFRQDLDGLRMVHPDVPKSLINEVLSAPPGVGLIEYPGEQTRLFRGIYTSYEDLKESYAFPKGCPERA